jgi:hypothetical protein
LGRVADWAEAGEGEKLDIRRAVGADSFEEVLRGGHRRGYLPQLPRCGPCKVRSNTHLGGDRCDYQDRFSKIPGIFERQAPRDMESTAAGTHPFALVTGIMDLQIESSFEDDHFEDEPTHTLPQVSLLLSRWMQAIPMRLDRILCWNGHSARKHRLG